MSQTISLPHSQVTVLGRAALSDNAIAFDWTNSGVVFRFHGSKAAISFEVPDRAQRLFVQLTVDGVWSRHCVCGDSTTVETPLLADGDHTVQCIRINEILDAVALVMNTITLTGSDAALLTPPTPLTRKIEFIGDSITCGFGVLTNGAGNGFKTEEQDGAHTYAALTARHFQAQAHYICISGRGISNNCDRVCAPLIPEFFLQTTVSHPTPWDFSAYQPDLVIINAGTNDVEGASTEEEFIPAADAFLKTLRSVYPNAAILWTYGMMLTGLSDAIAQVVAAQQDERIAFVPMTPLSGPEEKGACCHPNLRAHQRFAGVLIDAVSTLMDWEK